MGPKVDGAALRAELDWFLRACRPGSFPGIGYRLREEGNLLYGGASAPESRATA